MYTYRIVIGDYSKDGHNQMDYFTLETSHDAKAIQKAYKQAVKKSGVTLDTRTKAKHKVCHEYEDGSLPEEAVELLTELGVKWDEMESELNDDGSLGATPQDMANIFMEMVRTQLEGFTYKIIEPECLNGWGGGLGGIGYGCYN